MANDNPAMAGAPRGDTPHGEMPRGEGPDQDLESPPSSWRAWTYLIWISWRRQARSRWMTWIALGLLALTSLMIVFNTQLDRWNMTRWRSSRRGPTYEQQTLALHNLSLIPWNADGGAVQGAFLASFDAIIYEGSKFFVFSNVVVFVLYGSFLLPLWTLSFATEGLGSEREARNLIWVLTRPLSRPAIFLAKYLALLPWCLVLNVGGLYLMCSLAQQPGRLAFRVYWPAAVAGTFAFAALFHAMAALVQRPALLALLYAFFFESIAGNLPGQMKRLSISYYTRCLMFDRAHGFGIQPEVPAFYLPVSGTTATLVLAGATLVFLAVGALIFTRKEYLDIV